MLNLFKTISNENNKLKTVNIKKKSLKHFPSSTRDWDNTIYFFNKKALNLIPVATTTTINLIKSYFSLYNYKLERKIRKERLLLRLRRLSSNKIYVSNGGFKHTNNNVIITLYLYNRQKHNYLIKIKKEYFKIFNFYSNKLNNKFNLIKLKGFQILEKAYKDKYLILKTINKTTKINNTSIKNKNISEYIIKFYSKLIKKSLTKLNMYIYYKQLLFLNKSKYNYTYLQFLKKYIEKIFNKNVEFNLINLKQFYLNSDILSESLTLKLTRNRRKILRHLNNFKNKIKIQKKNFLLHIHLKKKSLTLKQNLKNKLFLKNFVLNNLKYKHITGFRLQAKGRLTKRYTASRSVSKVIYKGNLMNIDSSYRELSTVLLKGNLRSNVQYTKLKSKTRIGSFGIKGWISGI